MRVLVALLVAWASGAAEARQIVPSDGSPTALCLRAAHAAGALEGILDGLMGRLAQVESGRLMPGEAAWRPWPWTINADRVGYAFETKAEAVAWAEGAPKRGVKFLDAGCLQVNLQYHPRAFPVLEDAFDPWANARYAARYLRSLYEEAGRDWSVAVGWYHSHTPEFAYQYRTRVAALGQGIIAGLPPGPLAARLRAVGVMGVPLAGGGVLRIQLNRQPRGPGYRRPNSCEVAAAIGLLLVKEPKVANCGKGAKPPPSRVAARAASGP